MEGIEQELPNHWKRITLNDVAIWSSGGTPLKSNSDYYGGNIPWLIINDLNDASVINARRYISKLGLERSSAKWVPIDSVMVAMYGSIGKLGINKVRCTTNQAIAFTKEIFRSVYNKYLFYYLLFSRSSLHLQGKGGTQKNISLTVLKKFPIPLPPLNEQKRIINKIEELLSELDHAVESFKKIQKQLKIYRQAVLKAAFEGKLTAVSPVATLNSSSFEKFIPEEQEQNFNIDLPDLWILTRLKYLVNNVEYGSSYKSLKEGRVAVLRMGNIQNLKFDWNDLVFSSNEEEIQKYKLKKGDVLFNRTNSPELVGKTALYNGEQEAIFAGYLIRINYIKEILNPKYLNYYLNSFHAKKYGSYVKTDGVNQSNINGTKLKQYPIPICSLEEQNQIIQEIESRLSICDELEKTIEQNLILEKSLRQSILKKAFEGKLVPQDPNDEPAELLLEKIKLEKEKLAKLTNSSKTKAKREKVTA